ncbi:hypothetical protein TrVGV298_000268 [Trichoderma virens]|nr:hypothetical protein TrVGV298_000268 [Trichoderma virens]
MKPSTVMEDKFAGGFTVLLLDTTKNPDRNNLAHNTQSTFIRSDPNRLGHYATHKLAASMDGSLIGSSPWGSSKLFKSESGSEKETVEQPVHSLTSDAYLNKLTRVRMTSAALDKQIKDLAKKMKHMTKNKKKEEDNSDAKAEIRFQSEYAQAVLGIEFAKKKQEEILLERQIAQRERDTHVISQNELEERYGTLNRRYNCAGEDLWRSLNKKLHLENPEGIMLMQLEPKQFDTSVIPELLWPLYNTTRDDLRVRRERGEWIADDLGERKKPSNWIADVFEYYSAFPEYHGRKPEGHTRWCHVTGMWYFSSPRVARIIPFLMDENKLEEIVFGSESESLQRPANALLLYPRIQHWLEQYQIVIVPVDRSETPIKRWRTEFIYPGLENTHAATDETGKDIYGKDVDGRELSFFRRKTTLTEISLLPFHNGSYTC